MRKIYAVAAVAAIFIVQSLLTADAQSLDNYCRERNVQTGVLPHPQADLGICDQFILCVLFNTILQQCPPGRVFAPVEGANPPEGSCEPGNPETCEVFTPEPTTTTTQSTTTVTTVTGTQPPPVTNTTTYYTTTNSPGTPGDLCRGIIFRRIPYPNNCYQYIFCIAQIPHLGECGERQIFHPNWNICIRGDRNTCQFCLLC